VLDCCPDPVPGPKVSSSSLGASICFFLGAFQAATADDKTFLYVGIGVCNSDPFPLPVTSRTSISSAFSSNRRTLSRLHPRTQLTPRTPFQLAVVSNMATIILSIVSYMRHFLYLEDPRDPEESGSAHKHHHHFRRHKKHQDNTDEDV
jgi:hypothetical protein